MSYLTTDKKLVGNIYVTEHARNRFQERYGHYKIGDKKVKNASKQKLDRKIRKIPRNKRLGIKDEEDDLNVFVKTEVFEAIVNVTFHNKVITII